MAIDACPYSKDFRQFGNCLAVFQFVRKLKTSSFMKNIVKNHIIVAGDANEFKKILEKA